jgi:hypothetical protein
MEIPPEFPVGFPIGASPRHADWEAAAIAEERTELAYWKLK